MSLSIIGCVVNGPGEALMTDVGFTGGGAGAGMVYLAGRQDHKMDNAAHDRPHRRAGRKRAAEIEAEAAGRGRAAEWRPRAAHRAGRRAGALGPFAIDMYLPALPGRDLGRQASSSR